MKLIPCLLRKNALRIGQQPAVICGDTLLNYRAFDRIVDYSVNQLMGLGVKEGMRVVVISPVNIEHLAVLFALWRIGAIACIVSGHNPETAINEQCKKIKAKVILSYYHRILGSKRIQAEKIRLQSIVNLKIRDNTAIVKENIFYDLERAATVIFSSGSSGEPKAVQHSLGSHYFSAQGSNENIPVKLNSRWLVSLPLYHVSGLSIIFRCLLGGAALVIPDENSKLRGIIVKQKVTHVSLVAAQLFRLLADKKPFVPLKKLKAVLLGGSAIPEPLIKKAVASGLPVYVSYGLTEMASQVATTGLLKGKDFSWKAKLLRYRKVRISGEGEILLSGKTLFQGYVSGGKLMPCVDRQGWFHSGDIGYRENGRYLIVKGRKDRMFISGGENIFPEEIEQAIYKSGLVAGVVVVPVQSQEYGFRPIAFVKPKKNKRVNRLALIKYLSRHLPKFKIPEDFYAWPKKPVSSEKLGSDLNFRN